MKTQKMLDDTDMRVVFLFSILFSDFRKKNLDQVERVSIKADAHLRTTVQGNRVDLPTLYACPVSNHCNL